MSYGFPKVYCFLGHLDPEEEPIYARFVDGGVQFTELEEAVLSSFGVGAPNFVPLLFVLWGGPFFAEELLQGVAHVAVHTGYAWLDGRLCYIVDDLVIQP